MTGTCDRAVRSARSDARGYVPGRGAIDLGLEDELRMIERLRNPEEAHGDDRGHGVLSIILTGLRRNRPVNRAATWL
jgi:hypothetical protein